jgi:hypothetical protein
LFRGREVTSDDTVSFDPGNFVRTIDQRRVDNRKPKRPLGEPLHAIFTDAELRHELPPQLVDPIVRASF